MRTAARSIKLDTHFGKIYVHVDFTLDGCVHSVAFSQPGKLEDTLIGRFLDTIAGVINNEIAEIESDLTQLQIGGQGLGLGGPLSLIVQRLAGAASNEAPAPSPEGGK